jgi:hypothetical protein
MTDAEFTILKDRVVLLEVELDKLRDELVAFKNSVASITYEHNYDKPRFYEPNKFDVRLK